MVDLKVGQRVWVTRPGHVAGNDVYTMRVVSLEDDAVCVTFDGGYNTVGFVLRQNVYTTVDDAVEAERYYERE